MSDIFDLTREVPWNKGRLHRTIFDHVGKMVDIEFEVGCLKSDGSFFSTGVDKLPLQDQEEQKDMTTGKITAEAKTDYTDFLAEFAKAKDPEKLVLSQLEKHGIKKAQ